MRSTLITKILLRGFLAISLFAFTQCTSTSGPEPDWAQKNKELIAEHKLTVREISGLPKNSIESNLEPAKVKSLDKIDSTTLYPGVNGKLFWGSGITVAVLQLAPNAQIPEETLPADRFLFVLEGSVNQSISGSPVNMGRWRRGPRAS